MVLLSSKNMKMNFMGENPNPSKLKKSSYE